MSFYAIRPGELIPANQLTDADAFSAFPVQSDQRNYQWLRPENEADVIDPGVELRPGLHGGGAYVGAVSGTLPIRPVTAGMWAYARLHLLNNQASRQATYQTFDRTANVWRVYWIWMNAALPSQQFERAATGTRLWRLTWSAIREAPEGAELAIDITPSDAEPAPTDPLNFTVDVENVGDWQTTGNLVLLVDLPASAVWEFTGVTASAYDTIEYSTNNGGSYSPTPPAPLTDTTDLRLTRAAAVNAGATIAAVVEGTATADGDATLSAIASTLGAVTVNDSVTVAVVTP